MTQYEAGAHEAQMKILRALLLSDSAQFSDLSRAAELTNDHANFHIKQLLQTGFVRKMPKTHGVYELTRAGKEYANRMDTNEAQIEKQPKLSVVIIIEHEDGKFLQQQRLKQPYYGYWGNMTGKIRWGETMLGAAKRELMEETGLEAKMRVVGFYHKLDYDEAGKTLLEDKYFCMIYATNPKGKLIIETDGQRNEWLAPHELEGKSKKFGSAMETIKLARSGKLDVVEQSYHYKADDY